ncbi:MAG: hypothetical protein ACYTG7_24165 [Planctomycetota bacterium]|jgi:hypothetical protein
MSKSVTPAQWVTLQRGEVVEILERVAFSLGRLPRDWKVKSLHKDKSAETGRTSVYVEFDSGFRSLCPHAIGDKIAVREEWAARGKHTDQCSSDEIAINRVHFTIWYLSDCMEGGREKFNLDFLGRWRPAEDLPDWAVRSWLVVHSITARIDDGEWFWAIKIQLPEAL